MAGRRSTACSTSPSHEATTKTKNKTQQRHKTEKKQPEALALYRSAGFVEIGPFGKYGPDPLSLFMEKPLPIAAGHSPAARDKVP